MKTGTIVVGALLVLAVALIIRKMVKDRKAGKNLSCPSCKSGCDCGSCPSSSLALEMARALENKPGE